jgi:RimJ/RimL family protein N-acetyltransferase
LSPRTCQQRFLGNADPLTSGLAALTTVDRRDHFAWLALRLPDGDEMLGLAQFAREKNDPTVAEPALLVVDLFQGQGLGTALFRLLRQEASRLGVHRFIGTTLISNIAAIKLLLAAGAELTLECPGVLVARLELI